MAPSKATNDARRGGGTGDQETVKKPTATQTKPVVQANPNPQIELKTLVPPQEDNSKPVKVGELPPISIRKDQSDELASNFNIIFSALLVAVGAFQAWFLYRTLGAMRRQADSMDDQAGLLKESVAAANSNAQAASENAVAAQENVKLVRDQLRATQIAERAWVVPIIGSIQETENKGTFQIVCELTNNGRTPAWVTAAGSVGMVLSNGKELPTVPSYTLMGPFTKKGTLLAVGGSLPQGFPLSNDVLAKAVKQEIMLFVAGFIEYTDIYGEAHRTSYCHQLKRSQDLTRKDPLDAYFAGPAELNEAT